MANVEIEKKFLIMELPAELDSFEHRRIEQGYLCRFPTIRVRRDGDRYYMTYKGSGLMKREEYNLPLSEEAFLHLIPKADGHIIKKERYVIPISLSEEHFYDPDDEIREFIAGGKGLCVELDIFEYPEGLVMAEVEFPSLCLAKKFRPLPWFDREVTEDPKYHNSNMI